jgi:hypothetical protein
MMRRIIPAAVANGAIVGVFAAFKAQVSTA